MPSTISRFIWRAVAAFLLAVASPLVLYSVADAITLNKSQAPHLDGPYSRRYEAAFHTPTRVMTYEVGNITGDLRLATEIDGQHHAIMRIQYDQALDWYTVEGGYFKVTDIDCEEALHSAAVTALSKGDNDLHKLSVKCATPLTTPPA